MMMGPQMTDQMNPQMQPGQMGQPQQPDMQQQMMMQQQFGQNTLPTPGQADPQ